MNKPLKKKAEPHTIKTVFPELNQVLEIYWKRLESLVYESKNSLWKTSESFFASQNLVKKLEQKVCELNSKEICEKLALQQDLMNNVNILSEKVDNINVIQKDFIIDSAGVLALATPLDIIPAPGAGKYIVIDESQIFLDFETTPYTGQAGKFIKLKYENSGDIASVDASEIFTGTDKYTSVYRGTTNIGINEKIQIYLDGANISDGDSPLKLRLRYRVVDAIT